MNGPEADAPDRWALRDCLLPPRHSTDTLPPPRGPMCGHSCGASGWGPSACSPCVLLCTLPLSGPVFVTRGGHQPQAQHCPWAQHQPWAQHRPWAQHQLWPSTPRAVGLMFWVSCSGNLRR